MSNVVDRVLDDMYKQCKRKAKADANKEIKQERAELRKLKKENKSLKAQVRSRDKAFKQKDAQLEKDRAALEREKKHMRAVLTRVERVYKKAQKLKERKLSSLMSYIADNRGWHQETRELTAIRAILGKNKSSTRRKAHPRGRATRKVRRRRR